MKLYSEFFDKKIVSLIKLCACITLKNQNACYFLTSGILYRLGLLRRSFELFFPSLEELEHNDWECETVNVMLNSIYMHLRGVLDNTAWLLYYELSLQNLQPPRDIDFTGKKYRKSILIHTFMSEIIEKYMSWMSELKEKRDPIAHRLPLYIPSKFIDNDTDLKQATALKQQAKEKYEKKDYTGIQDELAAFRIGVFKPVIMNLNTEKKAARIYPILPEMEKDINNFTAIISSIFNELKTENLEKGIYL